MKKIIIFFLFLFLTVSFIPGDNIDNLINRINKNQIRAIVEFISDDLFEGRKPGTRGGELVEKYIRSIFKIMDIGPYFNSYFQTFDLRGFKTKELFVEANGIKLTYKNDIMGNFAEETGEFNLKGETVFAGYGIKSDAWNWNDYKDFDVTDKILIIRVNDPGMENESIFRGRELTYYGRWTYKYEQAIKENAKGVLLIHTDKSAGYDWDVVRNSWSGMSYFLPSTINNNLKFRGWIKEEKLKEILAKKGVKLESLYRKSKTREFKPINLGFNINIYGKSDYKNIKTNNVIGYIPGSHPELKNKNIVLSAHIDHLGKDDSLKGDKIYNGAIDNGSAVASMLMTSKILKEYQDNLDYSIVVLACQAEEEGLLGTRYFAEGIDPSKFIANINFESTPVWEKTRDFIGVGAKFSTLEKLLKKILKKEGLEYSYFSMSNQGFFYRSDQFSFARKGIPGMWITAGEKYVSGKNKLKEFFLGKYHTVEDEYDPGWELDSTIQTIKIAALLVKYINENKPVIDWKGKMTFPVEKSSKKNY